MADQNTINPGDVSFDADPALETRTTGGTDAGVAFDADESIGETKRTATQTIKDEASKLGAKAADKARSFASENKDKATGALDEVAKLVQQAANDVDERLGEQYGRYARSAADGITRFSDGIRGKEVDDLIADASDFVKKSPVIAVSAAAAVGFVLARLVKSGIDAASDLADPEPKDGTTTKVPEPTTGDELVGASGAGVQA